jgi:hypothetical protein
MSKNDHDIDTLLRRNAEQQLADFDWDGLRRDIGRRLTSAGAASQRRNRYRQWTAIAATIAGTVGVLVLATRSTLGPGRDAWAPGEARVVMAEAAHVIGTAQVSFMPTEKPAQCKVEILTSDKPRQQDRARASWCIIAAHAPAGEKHGNGGDVSDVLALF